MIVRSEERQLFLVFLPDTNLVITGHVIQSDEVQETVGIAKIVNSVIASGDWILEWQSDLVQTTIRDTQSPDELVYTDDVFLVWFGCENNSRTPRAITFPDPSVGFQDFEVFHNNLALMRSVTWLLATDGRRAAGVDRKFKVKNRLLHAGFVETIPVIFNNAGDGSLNGRVHVDTDNEVLFKFDEVPSAIPKMNVVSLNNEWFRRVAEGLAVLLKFKDVAVDVVAIIQGYVTVNRFGSPNLGRDIDNEVASKRRVVAVILLGRWIGPIRWRQNVGLQLNRSRDKWRRGVVVEVVGW